MLIHLLREYACYHIIDNLKMGIMKIPKTTCYPGMNYKFRTIEYHIVFISTHGGGFKYGMSKMPI